MALKHWIATAVPCPDIYGLRDRLEGLGVEVGGWNNLDKTFEDCVISAAALDKLDPLWGDLLWGPMETTR